MHEAKTHFSRLVERALAGEDVVIASNGRGLVRLIPLESPEAGLRPIGLHAAPARPARPLADFEHDSLTPLEQTALAEWES